MCAFHYLNVLDWAMWTEELQQVVQCCVITRKTFTVNSPRHQLLASFFIHHW